MQPEGASRPLLQVLSDSVNRWSERLLFLLMLLMIGVTTAQVVFRFFFEALTWSEELSCFLLVLASLLGAAVAFKRGSHIAVTFLAQKLSGTHRKAMAILVNLLGILFFAIVATYGAVLMKTEASQTTPAMMISMAWIYAMYPVLGVVIILHLAAGMGEILKGGRP
jgi:TRAP-type C4-dicarboxylate transport system permease small subunit